MERDVFVFEASEASEHATDYLRWENGDTLRITGEPAYLPEDERVVHVGSVCFKTPIVVSASVFLVEFIADEIEGGRRDPN